MLQIARRAVGQYLLKRQKLKMIGDGGAPASWYDQEYSGPDANGYRAHYSESKYLPLWESVCERIPKGSRILEVGCGPAQFAHLLMDRRIPGSYLGFDFSPKAIEMASRNVPGGLFELGDARTTDLFSTVDYEIVICTEVLEHITDDIPLLERIPRDKHVLATVPSFDYVSHVRFFRDACEVRSRYRCLFSSLEVSEHHHANDPDGSRGTFFLLNGVR